MMGRLAALLGSLFENGDAGLDEDFEVAFDYLQKACALNNSGGCASLGSMYMLGRYVKKDPKKAFDYFKQACDMGSAVSCSRMGFMYSQGTLFQKT